MTHTDLPPELIDELVGYLRSKQCFLSDAIERAFREVPRHIFLPTHPLKTVYGPMPIAVFDDSGEQVTVGSAPGAIAITLQGLGAKPGERILDVGTGTGWLAALIGHLVGPTGRVVSVELDAELVSSSNTRFAELGMDQVEARTHDAAAHLEGPWDGIALGASIGSMPRYWLTELAEGGRIIAPVAFSPSGQAFMMFTRERARLRGYTIGPASYVPFRGPHSPLWATESARVDAEMEIRSKRPSDDVKALRDGPTQRIPIAPADRNAARFLYWAGLRFPRCVILEGEGHRWFDAIGLPVEHSLVVRGTRWYGVARQGSVAVFGEVQIANGSALAATSFGDTSILSDLLREYQTYASRGHPAMEQIDVDIYPSDAPEGAVDRGWAHIALRTRPAPTR